MKRFVLMLALVAVAGATYVATAPGSQTAGPTAAQFRALKKQVTKLQKQVKTVNEHVNLLAVVNFVCMLDQTVGVAQKGDPGLTYGYSYNASAGDELGFTTALDLSAINPTSTLLTLNPDPELDCASLVGLGSLKRYGSVARWAQLHHWSIRH